MRSLSMVVLPSAMNQPSKVIGITQIADGGRAERGNLQFCDPGHLHPRQAVGRSI
jgi:hypothetical protein